MLTFQIILTFSPLESFSLTSTFKAPNRFGKRKLGSAKIGINLWIKLISIYDDIPQPRKMLQKVLT
ncbi:MAG: hypothetical protein QXO77_00340 [Saccharolobus sp.]